MTTAFSSEQATDEWTRHARGTEPQIQLPIDDIGPVLATEDIERVVGQLREQLGAITRELSLVDDSRSLTLDRALRRITDNVAALERVAGELADVAAIERGEFAIDRRSNELRSLIHEVLDRALSPRDRARCVVECCAACLAWIDAPRIERVILTLVDAALSSSSPLDAIVIRLAQLDGIARLSVIDAGRSMSAVDASTAFDRSTNGPGMFVSRCIVDAHGGIIGIDCRKGFGSRFYVELPVARGDDRTRVLLVDDDARQLGALAVLLRREGFDVSVADCGSAAITSARTRAVDVAIVDVDLPDVSAKELAAQLRYCCPTLPVIFVTGHPPDSARVVEAQAACNGSYLGKPIDIDLLLQEIGRTVSAR